MASVLIVALLVASVVVGASGGSALTADPVECDGPPGVAFWKFEDAGTWDPDEIRIGYATAEETDLLFVAYVDGVPLGVNAVSARGPTHADGAPIELDRSLSGEHEVRVVVHRDRDGDGQFDPMVDPPCLDGDGDLVQTGPATVDFSMMRTPFEG